MSISQSVVEYLRQNNLLLTTAESCTAGAFRPAPFVSSGPVRPGRGASDER
ncbi:CinA family protein [Pseudomonas sp. AL03]|uniref:CinA family protein n=1 Tax=Pseudomonas sp. AL03 TaxID=3042230 RepID=UPI00249B8A2B|nr:CinA family protein [Pseudomonas sp. AL03]MDI3273521.1 CinA family protein [Pseudomonas sp. AL03]